MAISLTHSRGGSCATNEWTEEFWNVMSSVLIGERLEHDFRRINQIETLSTRWAPTRHKWSYNPYKWPYKWATGVIHLYTPLRGVINLLITGRGPSCGNALFQYAGKWQTVEDKTPVYAIKHAGFDDRPVVGVGHIVKGNCCWQIQNSLENLRWLLIKIMDTFEVSKLVTASFRYCLNQPYHILYNVIFFTVFLKILLKIKSFWALKRCCK